MLSRWVAGCLPQRHLWVFSWGCSPYFSRFPLFPQLDGETWEGQYHIGSEKNTQLSWCRIPFWCLQDNASPKKSQWRRQWHPTPVLLPGKSHGQRSLVGCSPWGRYESDTTERLHFHFSLSCIGEGSGNPLQCSCLESPRDGVAWWAAVYGVSQSRTRLKWLSSSSSSKKSQSGKTCWSKSRFPT